MAGKAMYKIPTINTIFIIDMLQNNVPLQLQVFMGKVSDETVSFLIGCIKNKTWPGVFCFVSVFPSLNS